MAQVSKINLGGVDYDIRDKVLEQEVGKIQPIVNQGTINNAADEEDLTSENNLLKLKDRSNVSGKGYIILRKNKSFAEQVIKENTIYEIRYEYDLNGGNVTIPKGCILEFKGGKITNGNLFGFEYSVNANNIGIFSNVRFVGLVRAYVDWFITSYGNNQETRYDNTNEIQQALNCGVPELVFPSDKYLYITSQLNVVGNLNLITECDGNAMVDYRFDGATYGVVTDKDITMLSYSYASQRGGDSLYIGRLNLINNFYANGEQWVEQTKPLVDIIATSSIWGLTLFCNIYGRRSNYVGCRVSTTPGNYIQEIHINSDVISAFKGLELVTGGANLEEGYITDVTFNAKSVSAVIGADFGEAAEIRIFENCYQPTIYYDTIDNGAAFFMNGNGILKTAFVWDLSVYADGKYTCAKDYDVKSYNLIPSHGWRPSLQGKMITTHENKVDTPIGGVRNFLNVARNQGGNGYVLDRLVYQIDGVSIINSSSLYNDDLLFGESYYGNVQPFWSGATKTINRAFFKAASAGKHTMHIEFETRNDFTFIHEYGITLSSPYAYPTIVKLYKGKVNALESEPYKVLTFDTYNYKRTIIPEYDVMTKIVIDMEVDLAITQIPLPLIYLPYMSSDFGLHAVATRPNTECDGKMVVYKEQLNIWSHNQQKWLGADGLPAVLKAGPSSSRPWAVTAGAGAYYYDTDLKKPMWSDGANWFDAQGTHIA